MVLSTFELLKIFTMYHSTHSLAIVLAITSVTYGALLQKDGVGKHCHYCVPTNSTTHCDNSTVVVKCPEDLPYCATVSTSPDFSSTFYCAKTKPECRLTFSPTNESYTLQCTCNGDECNEPFSETLRQDLIRFASTSTTNKTDVTNSFLKSSKHFYNIIKSELFTAFTASLNSSDEYIDKPVHVMALNITNVIGRENPRAEALKQEATLTDDEEEEGEGSGWEERRRKAPAPAAPSAFLPTSENTAHAIVNNILLPIFSAFTILL